MGIPCQKTKKKNLYQNLKESWANDGNVHKIIKNEF